MKRRAKRAPVVHVSTRGGPFAGVSAALVQRRALKMLGHLGLGAVELSVALVDDPTIQALNLTYRRKNKPTDVLAFPLQEPVPAMVEGLLGDVILSIDTARRQAGKHRRPLVAELTMLLAHGLLHLLGHDHQTDAEEREMTARTRELEAIAGSRAPRAAAKRPSGLRIPP